MTNNNAIDHLDRVLREGSNFDFGHYWGEGLDIWKKNWTGFFGFVLILMIFSFALSLAPIVGQLISSLIVTPALTAGAAYAAYKIDLFDDNDFAHFFVGFKKIPDILLAALVQTIAMIACFLPFILAIGISNIPILMSGDFEGIMEIDWSHVGSWMWLLLIPFIFIAILFTYSYYFIAIYNLSGFDAVKYSCKYVMRHWIMVLVFTLLVTLFICLGLVALLIGIFFTMSMYWPLLYSSFKGITELNDFMQNDHVEDHLMEV